MIPQLGSSTSLPIAVHKLKYETFLMQLMGMILLDILECPPEFRPNLVDEVRSLNKDFVACGLMN